LPPFPCVDSCRPYVFKGTLPEIADVPGHRTLVASRWDLKHHRADVLRVEERHQVDHAGLGVTSDSSSPKAGPIADLIKITADVSKSLKHQITVDGRHPQMTASIARR
jgi:hypothetical protein